MKNCKIESLIFSNINFEEDVEFLYQLLISRKYSISHDSIPLLSNHRKFVKNHPYRCWYLISCRDTKLGSFYLAKDNSVGIDLLEPSQELYCKIIKKILNRYKPYPGIKSVRSSSFIFNIHPKNRILKSSLLTLNMKLIQSTYTADY